MKEKITNLFKTIGAFLLKILDYIKKGIRFVLDTKVMRAIGNVLGWIPKRIGERINNRQRKSIWGVIFIIPLMIGFIYFFAIPFILTIVYSFSYVDKISGREGLTTIFIGWNNYIYVFKDFTISINYESKIFTELLVKAFIEIITNLPIILIFSLIMAVVLNSKFAGRALVRAIFFMPVIFNSQAIDLAVASRTSMTAIINQNTNSIFENMFSFTDFLLMANLPTKLVGFLGDASSKIYDIISYSGIQILIFLTAIQSVPKQLYEAAKMEGATQYEMFWKITFPMVSPMLLTTAVYTIIDSYTRSTMIRAIKGYTNSKKSKTTLASGLTGKALELYNEYTGGSLQEYKELSNYGIGAALSFMYAIMVILLIAIVLGILSKAVFYYDD